MAKPELGSKRQCESCGAKFFDLNKDPILCPKCGATFQVTAASRASRAVPEDDEAEPDAATPDIVSLDEAEDTDAKVAAVAVPDEDIDDDDEAADDTFLEEEEEGSDDVAGLIDGDIETDDEN